MIFNSWSFVVLLLVTFALYYTPRLRFLQVGVLIAASFVFYAYENPWLLFLLVASIAANAALSYSLMLSGLKRALLLTAGAVILNVVILSLFKYAAFFYSALHPAERNSSVYHFLVSFPLPIGISFYTFEGISLIVDTYRSKKQGTPIPRVSWGRHLINTTLFISFFPHLVSGPILKAKSFYPQIREKWLGHIPWSRIFSEIITGFFLKLVIADNLKDLTFYMADPQFHSQPGVHLAALIIAYSVQIFSDFAGYSLIALGVGRLFGYDMPPNFNFPYFAASIREFWQRWHMSLSQWLRDYLYIPLGGNQLGRVRTYFNLIFVMLVGGLWHGAASGFILWGAYHGIALAVERFFAGSGSKPRTTLMHSGLRVCLVFLFVSLGWLLFRLVTLDLVFQYLTAIIRNWKQPVRPAFLLSVGLFSLPVFFYHVWQLLKEKLPKNWKHHAEAMAYSLMIFFILFNSGSTGRFIYFKF